MILLRIPVYDGRLESPFARQRGHRGPAEAVPEAKANRGK